VKRFLGEGGKKKVYLAHDTQLDRDVAFALIKTEGLDEAARERILREARAMARLSDNPHIMPIYELGQETGQPYMVLPLMGGGDVEGLIKKAPNRRIPLPRVLEIATQVCQGLQFAHARGIVHRDLKPGNVWLTSDGTAKIGDFGLALPLGGPRLTVEGMMVGTVAYMPPEQALGGEVTPKADLYSLGAMLYELVTGRPPFLGDDAVAIIGQHLHTPPVAPTWHNSACPRALEALILRLLAKDPSERPESAADVLTALEGTDLRDVAETPLGKGGMRGVDDAHALDSLAGGVFVGRQREMGELKVALEEALSGRGRLVLLVGEPGIGKTRTAQELCTYAGLRQCQVLWGRCYEGQGAPPYWPWVQAIRSYVREHEDTELRSQMGSGAADIAEVVSDVRERLPDLKPPPALEPEAARFRLFDSISAFLKSASRQQPLVLVLDDLHWADKPSLLLLQFVARELGNGRVLLLGAYRDVELSRQHPLAETLGELTRERLFQRVLLRGLSQEDVGRFIELVAGITPLAGLVEAVYRQTEGNPLFVTEVVRLLVQEGGLTPGPSPLAWRGVAPTSRGRGEADSWSVRIPEGVKEVIGRRLNRLSARCNQVLTLAAVLGREFDLRQLARLLDPSASSGQTPGVSTEERLSEERLLEVVEEALGARVIEELPRLVGRYQFSHALIQETLLGELSLTRRVRLHARIAETLEAMYGSQAEAHAAELAHHFAEAQAVLGSEKLVRYSLLAGERALAAYAWEEALAHFERGLTSRGIPLTGTEPAKDAEAAALLFSLGRAQFATLERHESHEAVPNWRRAFDYYVESGDVAHALAVAEYPVPPMAVRSGGVAQIVARALALVPPDSHAAGHLWSHYGLVISVEGDYEGAQAAFTHALAIAQREQDPALELQTLAFAARDQDRTLRYQESLETSLRAIDLAKAVDEPRAEVQARARGLHSLMAMGRLEEARELAAASLPAVERRHHRYEVVAALRDRTLLAELEGNWPAAREFSDRGLAISPNDLTILVLRALLEHQSGDSDQGHTYLERSLETLRLNPTTSAGLPLTATAIPIIARITGMTGRPEIAEIAETTARAVLASPSVDLLTTTLARTALALLAVQRGDAAAAREQYAALESRRGIMLLGAGVAFDRLLGLLAQTMGNLVQAVAHFEDALAFCRKAGYRPELAWSLCEYADALLGRGVLQYAPTPADRQKAMALLDEALAISTELGMKPLMERVLSRRQILRA
jgi:tetratricopeptide (TPR) repeat protein